MKRKLLIVDESYDFLKKELENTSFKKDWYDLMYLFRRKDSVIEVFNSNIKIGVALLDKNAQYILCPKCEKGHLFKRTTNSKIECTNQPNCDYNRIS